MNIFNTDERSRGQVGIGTLIVFIAMVLVAAIAAGVLINTAGFLQTQAEDTGTESTQQVADNLNVITEVGEVGGFEAEDDEIGEVRLGVQPAAGSDDINLAELSLQYVSDDDFANLVTPEDGDVDPTTGDEFTAGLYDTGNEDYMENVEESGFDEVDEDDVIFTYGIELITAENEDDVIMTDNADRYELIIRTDGYEEHDDGTGGTFDAQSELGPLDEGSEVEVTITTEVGAQTVAFLQVPDTLSGQESEDTVTL